MSSPRIAIVKMVGNISDMKKLEHTSAYVPSSPPPATPTAISTTLIAAKRPISLTPARTRSSAVETTLPSVSSSSE